jgi:hypothetical protein
VGNAGLPVPPNTEHLSGQRVEVLARPEDIELSLDREALRGHVIGTGVLENLTFAGPLQRASVRLGEPYGGQVIVALLTGDTLHGAPVQVDQPVWVGIKTFYLLPSANEQLM